MVTFTFHRIINGPAVISGRVVGTGLPYSKYRIAVEIVRNSDALAFVNARVTDRGCWVRNYTNKVIHLFIHGCDVEKFYRQSAGKEFIFVFSPLELEVKGTDTKFNRRRKVFTMIYCKVLHIHPFDGTDETFWKIQKRKMDVARFGDRSTFRITRWLNDNGRFVRIQCRKITNSVMGDEMIPNEELDFTTIKNNTIEEPVIGDDLEAEEKDTMSKLQKIIVEPT